MAIPLGTNNPLKAVMKLARVASIASLFARAISRPDGQRFLVTAVVSQASPHHDYSQLEGADTMTETRADPLAVKANWEK
jgi:hypothetical protein